MRPLLLFLAGIIRALRRWIVGFIIVGLLCLNILAVSVVGVFEAVRGVVLGLADALSIQVEMVGWRESLDDRTRLITELDEAVVALRDARADLARVDDELADARLVADVRSRRITQLEAERARILEQVEDTTARLRTAQGGLARLGADNDELRALLIRSFDEARVAREGAQGIIARIQARTMRVAGRNVLAEPATAIPIVGTLGVGALLAYELNASCETVRDLEALSDELGLAQPEGSPALAADMSCAQIAVEFIAYSIGDRHAACYAARVATQTIGPPECQDLPPPQPEIWDISDPDPDPEPSAIPLIDLPPELD